MIHKKASTINYHHTSPLQYSIHAYPYHKLIDKGIGRISYFPTSPTAIPNTSLLDHNSTCFPGTPGMSLERF